MNEHHNELLGAYAIGVLDGTELAGVQAHVSGCLPCQRELDDLREMEAALGEIPPEAFLDGPPRDGDLLLHRTLQQVRAERQQEQRRRHLLLASAAAVAAIAVLAGGAVIGRVTAPVIGLTPLGRSSTGESPAVAATGPAGGPSPTTGPLPPAGSSPAGLDPAAGLATVAGTRVGSAVDGRSGARMSVVVQPAAGWVRVRATVDGVPAGEQCHLYVVDRDGARREAGSWLVPTAGVTTVDGSALTALIDVASVDVVTFAGRTLVSVPV